METPAINKTPEDYHGLFEVHLEGIGRETLKRRGTYNFLVTSNYNVYITNLPHGHAGVQLGVGYYDLLTEGYLRIREGVVEVDFKDKPESSFDLRQAIREEILDFLK
jgi:hypothetical protein